jgi:hypothetical protein
VIDHTSGRLREAGAVRRFRTTFSQAGRLALAEGPDRFRKPPCVFGLRMRGELNPAVLEESLTWLARRHTALRMYFPVDESVGFGFCLPVDQVRWPLAEVDLRAVPADERSPVEARAVADACASVSGRTPPLFRAVLLRHPANESLLAVIVDHLVFDGASIAPFCADLETVYGHLVRGGDPAALDEEVSDFARFSETEHDWLNGPDADAAMAYWTEVWRDLGPYPVADFPVVPPATAQPPLLWHRTLPVDGLRAAQRRHGPGHVSPFILTAAAVLLALGETTGQRESGVLHPSSRRFIEGSETLIGYLNTRNLLCVPTPPGASLSEIVTETRIAVCAALEHAMMPFDLLLQRLAPEYVGRRPPGPYVLVNVESAPRPPRLPGLDTDMWSPPIAGSFAGIPWISVELQADNDGAVLTCGYDVERFDSAFVDELMGRVAQLILCGR